MLTISGRAIYWTMIMLFWPLGFVLNWALSPQISYPPRLVPMVAGILLTGVALGVVVELLAKRHHRMDIVIVIYVYFATAMIVFFIAVLLSGRVLRRESFFLIDLVWRYPISLIGYYIFGGVIHCVLLESVPPLRRFREAHILTERG